VPNGGDVCELKNGREYMYVWSIDRYWRKNTLSTIVILASEL